MLRRDRGEEEREWGEGERERRVYTVDDFLSQAKKCISRHRIGQAQPWSLIALIIEMVAWETIEIE